VRQAEKYEEYRIFFKKVASKILGLYEIDFREKFKEMILKEDVDVGRCIILVRFNSNEKGYFVAGTKISLPGLSDRKSIQIDDEYLGDDLKQEYKDSVNRISVFGEGFESKDFGFYEGECIK